MPKKQATLAIRYVNRPWATSTPADMQARSSLAKVARNKIAISTLNGPGEEEYSQKDFSFPEYFQQDESFMFDTFGRDRLLRCNGRRGVQTIHFDWRKRQ
jgi:hypothetical protein